VPKKADRFPFGIPPDHSELASFVACHHGFPRSKRKVLVFFRPITQRIDEMAHGFALFEKNMMSSRVFIARRAVESVA
jgi:hypothetical protein